MEIVNLNLVKKNELEEQKIQKFSNKISFNRYLYDENKDIKEYNSGEYLVDDTGYIELDTLLQRCGLRIPDPKWDSLEFKTDKFTDTFDSQNEINNLLNNSNKSVDLVEENKNVENNNKNEVVKDDLEKKVDTE